jgi:uncharacterized membrane protein YeaQ/YmgE (transglycosylase-associated protein family)
MEVAIWIVVGALIGSSAHLLMPGPRAGGPVVAIVICVAAAIVGGLLGHMPSEPSNIEGFRPISRISAGAVSLLAMLALRSWAMRYEPASNRFKG